MADLWFAVIAFFWAGYFLLEGFDFGVGALLPWLRDRDTALATIGPVWDGNEVWVVVAVGATFAAFPDWYATLLSAMYLPLVLILVALILRGVALEYRGKVDDARWRRRWDRVIVGGSTVPAVLWGLVFADVVHGLPVRPDHAYAGGPLDLLHPYALVGGAATGLLFALHGAVFVALKTAGPVRAAARRLAGLVGVPAAVAVAAFLAGACLDRARTGLLPLAGLAVAAVLAALVATRRGRDGRAFAATAVAVLATTATLFLALYPAVLPSSLGPAGDLTVRNASASGYALRVMTWTALAFTPLVLGYQAWTYWVFRRRLTATAIDTISGAADQV